MEVRRATAPAKSSGSVATATKKGGTRGEANGARGVLAGGINGTGGVASNDGVTINGGIPSNGGTNIERVGELAKRRFANDPAMMRELKRYQNLMLLTLLPAITSEADYTLNRPHVDDNTDHSAVRGQPEGAEDVDKDKDHNEHLPLPVPTDGIVGVAQYSASRRNSQQAKSAGSHGSRRNKSFPAGPASAGTRLPLAVYNPLDTSPRPKPRRKSHEDASPQRRPRRKNQDEENGRRRKSQGDDGQQGWKEDELTDALGGSGSSGAAGGSGGGELDLLTLAALYLESRHRVFGQEWHHRPDNIANIRPTTQLGGTGVARPRRLTPLSPTDTSPTKDQTGGGKEPRTFSAVIPTPAGLHLSVNYTHNLDLEESAFIAERARALRPRLRRLNSMDDLLPGTPNALSRDLQKATSAPDLSHSGHGKRTLANMHLSPTSSVESISPPLVTPARANTPTEAKQSAALVRPQMVGGSLATYSAVDTARTTNISYSRNSDSFIGPINTRLRQLPETSRTALPPPKPPFRPAKVPPDTRRNDLPLTPPPTATVEGHRKSGRVHLQPLTIRKFSN
ncbi:uncharacterized protein LOC121873234 [Homarus americanus]|uniref:Uncharacterized protein n=1 Tax=Homarus americanus TaxID=6706 RepID=A0A8J5JVE6_HOMAM|nr:uncharacterized protein LOC121873234 [Homarus americanus]XP_042232546.1 uncharacterized protein LOC121873234 [Homarus americanus]KAG7163076.1 hypothetical protein Hamer_G002146 [Homarus americanus]